MTVIDIAFHGNYRMQNRGSFWIICSRYPGGLTKFEVRTGTEKYIRKLWKDDFSKR